MLRAEQEVEEQEYVEEEENDHFFSGQHECPLVQQKVNEQCHHFAFSQASFLLYTYCSSAKLSIILSVFVLFQKLLIIFIMYINFVITWYERPDRLDVT